MSKRLQKIADSNLGEQSEAAKRVLEKRAKRNKYKFFWRIKQFLKKNL